MKENIPIISVTGTKGKTTTVAIIADVLQKLGSNVLKVDTTGHFVNGKRRSTLDDSKATWRLVPSVCPGRYLWEFQSDPDLKKGGVAVLECSLGCSALSGLGYRYHDIGVFLNVFEDHLGSSDRINSREDIAKAKSFIFSRLSKHGKGAVFNADDKLVVQTLSELPNDVGQDKLVAVGLKFNEIDTVDFLKKGGTTISVNDAKEVVIKTVKKEVTVAELKNIPWTFDAEFEPSIWNILSAVAAVYLFCEKSLPDNFKEIIEGVRLDPYGGRLTLLKAKNGTTILADYAHEKVSLCLVGGLARKTLAKKPGSKIIGVVRLAHDRTDKLMVDTGVIIAGHFDEFVVYEKIDGYWRKPSNKKSEKFPQIVGRTSEIFAKAIASANPNVTRILREDEAIEHASKIAGPDDIVVVIVNDDIKRSIGFIKDNFKARFL